MIKLSQAAKNLWAKKSDENGNLLWLPLTVHLADSAAVARKLWNQWLPEGVKKTIADGITGKQDKDPQQLFEFLAAAHDLGKATPVFQAKEGFPLCHELDERIEEGLRIAGLPMRSYHEFLNASKTPHALASLVLLEAVGCPLNVAVILGAHHGKPPERSASNEYGFHTYPLNYYLEEEGKEAWTVVQKEILTYILDLAEISDITKLPVPDMKAQVLLCGLLIMTDWIASNERYFPYIRLEDNPDEIEETSRAKAAWEKLSLPCPWTAGNTWMNTDLYMERFGFDTPNTMQSAVTQVAAGIHAPGILVLEAPMGSGKTEAALACAEIFADKANRSGVFFALPTQATSDGIFPRMEKWIKALNSYGGQSDRHSIELAHGKAHFNEKFQALKHLEGSKNIGEDEKGGAFVHEWFEGKKKVMLADFVVGTIDQLLLAALKQKHVMMRHLGLADKVVIIDECHAYDAYMGQYLCRALNWLGAYHVPVIVLSATLPAQKRKAVIEAYLNKDFLPKQQADPLGRSKINSDPSSEAWMQSREYPLITYTDAKEVKQKEVLVDEKEKRDVLLNYLRDEELIGQLDHLLSGGGCAGVIVNTIKRAQELTQLLGDHFGKETVLLLHSLFLAQDRAEKEKQLLKELGKPGKGSKRPNKRIVVGTQVLEQSLDIDFDVLVTDICPMDLLLQRIGRLHRHVRSRPEKLFSAVCYIMGVKEEGFEEGSETIYGRYLLLRTKALLPQRITLPGDIPQLVQDVYDENLDPEPELPGYREAKQKQEKQIDDKQKRAKDFQICPPWPKTSLNIAGWLDTDVSDKRGEAAVRDTDESIEVLLIQERKDGEMCFLPWVKTDHKPVTCGISPYEVPDNKTAMLLACQRIRLPHAFCVPWMIEKTIAELEQLNNERLSEWQKSPWLKGELFLILDDKYSTHLNGYHLVYDRDYGLLYEKEDGENV